MKRNKKFKEFCTPERISKLAKYYDIDMSELYRMGAKNLYKLFKAIHNTYNEIIEDSAIDFRTLMRKECVLDEKRLPKAEQLPEINV